MKVWLVLLGLLAALSGFRPQVALGHYATPPPPPTLAPCIPCNGPPAPPAPVPTAPPGALPPVTVVVSVSVHLAPSRVRRGETVTLQIISIPKASVVVLVRYGQVKPSKWTARTNGAGKLRLSWKVSPTAPLGRAVVTVQVKHLPKPYVAIVPFTVLA